MEIAELGIAINYGSADAATRSLDNLTASSARAQSGNRDLTRSMDQVVDHFNMLRQQSQLGGMSLLQFKEQGNAAMQQLRQLASQSRLTADEARYFAQQSQIMATTMRTVEGAALRTQNAMVRVAFGVQSVAASGGSLQGLTTALGTLGGGAWVVGLSAALSLGSALFKAFADDAEESAKRAADALEGLSRVRLQARLAENQADLARAGVDLPSIAAFGTGGAGGAANVIANFFANINSGNANVARLVTENAALTASINAIDVATGHAARTTREHAAAVDDWAEKARRATVDFLKLADVEFKNVISDLTKAQLAANDPFGFGKALEHLKDIQREIEHTQDIITNKTVAFLKGQDPASAGRGGNDASGIIGGAFGFLQSGGSVSGLGGLLGSLSALSPAAGIAGSVLQGLGDILDGNAVAAERMRQAQIAYNQSIMEWEHQITGVNSTLQQAQDAARSRAMQERAQAEQAYPGLWHTVDRMAELARIDTDLAEALYRAQQDWDRMWSYANADLGVRTLRAGGDTSGADALALQLQQQKELDDARRNGADDAYLLALREVQLMETRARAMAGLQDGITHLTSTIGGLQSFRDAIALNRQLTTLSPIQQLAEARRQYESVLGAARGGDQTAAGRLSTVGQAFLEASRSVNASGMAYASDFDRVRSETASIQKMFEDQRTAAQQQVDELKKQNDKLTEIGDTLGTTLDVTIAGMQTNADGLVALRLEFADLKSAITRGAASLN
jgi:hypothetical protein